MDTDMEVGAITQLIAEIERAHQVLDSAGVPREIIGQTATLDMRAAWLAGAREQEQILAGHKTTDKVGIFSYRTNARAK